MYYKEYRFDDVLKHLNKGDKVVLMSDEKKYTKNSKVVNILTNNDYSKVTGVNISAVFVDVKYYDKFTLNTLHYLLTRLKGNAITLFPDKIYFTSDLVKSDIGYTFCGNLNIYE
jgi:hypothetical protein